MTSIYGLVDPSSGHCRYVGKTKHSLQSRLRAHINDAVRRGGEVPRFRWINKLLGSGVEPAIIELESSVDDWEEAESFWIAYMRSLGCDLLNATAGGHGLHGFRHRAETRAKQSAAALRRYQSADERRRSGESVRRAYQDPSTRERLSAALRVSHARPEVQAKLSVAAKRTGAMPHVRELRRAVHAGKTLSVETRAKISRATMGRKIDPESAARGAAKRRGQKRSPEARAKIAAGLRAFHDKRTGVSAHGR